ncbi:MAG: hypothetical protein EAZ60_04085 [Oscillatoriales cyanobacterium]|nr:hypothetical protein [Microcoleus sp. PH2017_21_RUC_O_A]TAE92025.1 MAG: hypothetical protein EAZ79_30645 [Oscillatoriales cyanobacterium]TAF24320.1 MAG: hypothetical protein EAZ73_00020 [Oscillatoriales cyanobacterium]TAF25436.1 MAG: hypothetical protein EAZ69_30050 [Oscillatoriales cyanobacterium]TAF58253.1 MAG: hypothetical protein EAZ60_04085 [Oscillatoriales cyanobacterium]
MRAGKFKKPFPSKWCDSRRDGIFTLIPPTMHKTYPPEVREQIRRFLLYKNGKQMVKRYLAILSSPEYADGYKKRRSTKKTQCNK